jgi:hypothetical protein
MNPGASDAPAISGGRNGKLRAILVAVLAIAVALILLGTLISLQEKWIVRTVRTENQSTSLVDMAVDGFDRIHVLYDNDYGVTYKILDGSFKYDVSSPGGVVGLALDVDGMGKAHFAIVAPTVDPNQFYVGYYSYGNHGIGESELIDYNITPFAPSIAVDQSGYVHVTYSKQGNLMYATNLGGVWSESVVISGEPSPNPYPFGNDFETVVGVDSKDVVHICYSTHSTVIGYVTNASGAWANEILYDWDVGGDSFDMVVDSNDNVQMCFDGIMNSTAGPGIVYCYNSGSGWSLEKVAKIDRVDFITCSIDVNRTGSPRIAYRSPIQVDSGYHLMYIEKTGGSWHQSEVATVGQQMGPCHLVVNDEDIPYVAFPDSGLYRYATTSLTLSELAMASLPGILLAVVVAVMCAIIIMRIR